MKILADADALPSAVREMLCRASQRVGIRLVFVANTRIDHPRSRAR